MKKPDPTRRQVERFVTASTFRYRMELVLEFDHPVSVAKGREETRRLLDALRTSLDGYEPDQALGPATLKCSELRRLIRLKE